MTGELKKEFRCITISLGDNCLNYYSSSTNIGQDSVCSQCYRGYVPNPAKSTECISADVYPPYRDTTTQMKDHKTLSQDATQSATPPNSSPMFPSATYNATTSAGTFCEQGNGDMSKCLACKNNTCAVYTASSWTELFDRDLQTWRTTYVYRANMTKVVYQLNFTDYTYPVSNCFFCSKDEVSVYPKEANIFYINGVAHYQCRWAHGINNWTKNDMTMTLSVTVSATNIPPGFVLGTTNSYTSSCQYDFGPTPGSTPSLIPNRASTFNDTDLALSFNQRALISSFQVCMPNYLLSYAVYNAVVSYGTDGSQKKTFNWILNECTAKSQPEVKSYFYVENCFVYEKTSENDQVIFYCKDCNPGSYPVFGTKPMVCLRNDTYHTFDKHDHCSGTRICDENRRCREVCTPPCDPTTEYCTFEGRCVKTICPYCAANTHLENCLDSVDGCPSDMYCDKGECLPKCTCPYRDKYDASTNYFCEPYACGTEFDLQTIYEVYNSIESRKQAKVAQMIADQEKSWLVGNQTLSSIYKDFAQTNFTTANNSLSIAQTLQSSTCNIYLQIIDNPYENMTETTDFSEHCDESTALLASIQR